MMRIRLILSFALIVLVAVISMALIARQSTADQVRTFMFRGGMSGTEGLVGRLEDYYAQNGSWTGVDTLLAEAAHAGQGRMRGAQGMGMSMDQRLMVADAQGTIIADTGGAAQGILTDSQLELAISLYDQNTLVGYLLPESGTTFNSTDETRLVSSLNQAAWSAALIAGGVALLLALLLVYQFMRPVRALTTATTKIAGGDLSQRVPQGGSDELGQLANTFNHMADSLQAAENSRRAMTADIAHELRTPLAVQRAHLEAILDGVYPMEPDYLAQVLEQNHLLTRLVDDLRTLALADAGQLELVRYPANLPELARRTLERFSPQAQARQIQLVMQDPPEDARLQSLLVDPGRVEQILGNLFANALRYTPDGGQISIRLETSSTAVQLHVCDSGPGIPPEALPHLFERFYRADKSRSRQEGGTGLGLPIARQLARAHGGDLTARNHPQGGAEFTLTLPLPAA
jgi:two-component system sensor histidine kinase BaeS